MKLLFKPFCFCLLSAPLLCSANIGVLSSGIDWSQSFLHITGYEAAEPKAYHENLFNCDGYSYSVFSTANPIVPINLELNGFSGDGTLPETDDTGIVAGCFRQAGVYEVRLELADNAGNKSLSEVYTLEIKPSVPDENESTITPVANGIYSDETNLDPLTPVVDCALGAESMANGKDFCRIKVELKDEYKNVVKQPGVVLQPLQGAAADTSIDLIYDVNEFYNGVRLNSGSDWGSAAVVIDPTNYSYDFDVKSLAPTLSVYYADPSIIDDNDGDGRPDFALASVEPKNLDINIVGQGVENDGSFSGMVDIEKSLSVIFRPLVNLSLTNEDPTPHGINISHFANPVRNLPLQVFNGVSSQFYVLASTLLPRLLPENFTAKVQSHTIDGMGFESVALDPPLSVDFNTVNTGSDFREITSTLQVGSNVIGADTLALGSEVNYTLDGVSVRHPGGNLGSSVGADSLIDPFPLNPIGGINETFKGSIVGADIEGRILSEQAVQVYGESKGLSLGTVNQTDVREKMFNSAFNLTRGLAAETGDQAFDSVNEISFNNNNVAYFKGGTVQIGALAGQNTTFEGVKTIVIEDGNLVLLENWFYNSPNDSIGIILINNQTVLGTGESYPATGHVFVHNLVQHMTGTFFMDGGLISTDKINPTVFFPVQNIAERESSEPSAPFARQLLLEGTFLGNNTLGGSFSLANLYTPWKGLTTTEKDKALLFDLHFIRRYAPSISTDSNCYRASSTSDCDASNFAFVVRPDERVKVNPPPGFKSLENLSLN